MTDDNCALEPTRRHRSLPRPETWLLGPPPTDGQPCWRRVYPGRLDQVSAARAFPAEVLADTERAEDAALITSELVTNALLHTRSSDPGGWFGLEVTRPTWPCDPDLTGPAGTVGTASTARIAVHDLGGRNTPRLPRPSTATAPPGPPLHEHARGLPLVACLALDLGWSGTPRTGHTVWAVLAITTHLHVLAPTQLSTPPTINMAGSCGHAGHGGAAATAKPGEQRAPSVSDQTALRPDQGGERR